MLLVRELPYLADSTSYFSSIAGRNWSMFLDSGGPDSTQGRYDIVVSDPLVTLVSKNGQTTVSEGEKSWNSGTEPLTLLQKHLQAYSIKQDVDLPFSGGALGYFSYDLGRHYFALNNSADDDLELPDMAVGIYGWALVNDHHQRRTWIAGQGGIKAVADNWDAICALFEQPGIEEVSPVELKGGERITANMDAEQYHQAIDRIKQYLYDGDCYQVNFSQRFTVPFDGDPWHAYLQLRKISPAPYGAFLSLPFATVLSNSPELFLQVDNGQVITSPIKGTRPRLKDEDADKSQMASLSASEKDRAENLMIVDLLRNDLGKVCQPGTVKVKDLFAVESFATVHHLVSTVTGKLLQGQTSIDLLRACFPGGSITGAPKKRAMEIIEELEPQRRGIYCGAIGYVGFDGSMNTNISIRTLVVKSKRLYYWAGGGIVIDSEWEDEYQECFDKAEALFRLLQA